MIRRPLVTCACVAFAVSVMAGCGTFSENSNAAEVNDHELSVDDFQAIAEDLVGSDSNGEFVGSSARSLLTEWVQSTLITDALLQEGIVIDDAARAEAAQTLEESNPDAWAELAPATQDFVISVQAAQNAIVGNDEFVSEEELRTAYEAGAATSNLFCLRILAVPDQATADEVAAQLADGADFATLAEQYPVDPTADPATQPEGGIFLNPNTSGECMQASEFSPEIGQVISNADIGVPTEAIPLQGTYLFVVQRPHDEVAEAVRTELAPALGAEAVRSLTGGSTATIDSRYGMWDAEVGQVVPAR